MAATAATFAAELVASTGGYDWPPDTRGRPRRTLRPAVEDASGVATRGVVASVAAYRAT
ncbi:hypothetical protein MRBLWH7_003470 [Microbacterium sp. LWH7-1.2]|uniref:hypothetical protein n=1 Tax=Microbacterium sp. LWH7-1.2 TaxID=3135257 RepID=UPI0031396906